ncbi:hypothetical protein ECC02_011225 [Trypanosoma cruzi]|uniref:Uncharacterized protein n=1 Tax=Trypanosoma cruzi TaxID=5693 RepID=A0A7J6XQC7_TRYCR|nr:hypothetical protein ECC02_011225 [Trypanosoma cruzi]
MRSRCAATSATSSQSNSSVSSTSSTIAGTPRPRNTHSATMSCRLSSPMMSATPNAYLRTCSMRWNHPRIRLAVMNCILLSSLCLEQTLPSSRSTAWVLREAAEKCHFCGRSRCAETTATLTPSHLRSLHSPTHKGGVMGKRSPPHSACTRAQTKAMPSTSHRKIEPCAQHTHGRNERDGRIQVHAAVLYFPPHPRIGRTTHSDALHTPSASLRAHSAGQRPVTLVPSQRGAQTIVVADHRCR